MNSTVELSVIDEQMIQNALEEQGPQDNAGRIAKEEGIQYNQVIQLRLDYRNILKIGNLWQFTSLKKLQLDNNNIDKIQGLENLINLEWLDLSFNKIEVIEGLDNLVKLQDLSLYNNCISKIQNLDRLINLQILSLGNNLIEDLDDVEHFWPFKKLRTLILAGNPICKEEKYKVYVAAFLPELVYLDFVLLDEQARKMAEADYTFENKKQDKLAEERSIEAQMSIDKELQMHKDAFVEYLNGSQLFDSMVADDVESAKLATLPGVDLESYRNTVLSFCKQLFKTGLDEYAKRQEEVDAFFSCYREAVAENQKRTATMVSDFEKSRKKKLAEMKKMDDPSLLEAEASQFSEEITGLYDTLMVIEVDLLEQIEEVSKEFERNVAEMVELFSQRGKDVFSQSRDEVKRYHEKLLEISVSMSKLTREDPEGENLSEEMWQLFEDKDLVSSAVNNSLDAHLLKIDNREDEFMKRMGGWLRSLMELVKEREGNTDKLQRYDLGVDKICKGVLVISVPRIHTEAFERNRQHVLEVDKYILYAREQLEKVRLCRSQE